MGKERQQLLEAQNLFKQQIIPNPDFAKVETIIGNMNSVMGCYSAFQDQVSQWAAMRFFCELDIGVLVQGIELLFVTRVKKLPKECSKIAAYDKVLVELEKFKDGLPLISDLKSDVLRPRHWQKLMAASGNTFDISPDVLTPESVFSMELSEHKALVGDVVTGAQNEAAIEKPLSSVNEFWKSVKLETYEYKGGMCLRPSDEITSPPDDNLMNLSSMAASKLCVHFIDKVRNWGKALGIAGEVLEGW